MASMILKRCWCCNKEYTGFLDDNQNGLGRCDKCNKEVAAKLEYNKLVNISSLTINREGVL